jgi:hypothetical protein
MESFLSDARNIIDGTSLSVKERITLVRNMTMYILTIQLDSVEGNLKKRKDTIVRESTLNDAEAKKRVEAWLNKANYNRYYLSYLKRGLINFIKTGNLEESSFDYKAKEEDLLFCSDILKEGGTLEQVMDILAKIPKPSSLMFSDDTIKEIIKSISYTIHLARQKVSFLINNKVIEESFFKTDLEMWAYRTMFSKEGVTDIVYLINYIRQAVMNHALNMLEAYTAQKRYNGIVKVNDEDSNVKAEYVKIESALTDEIKATYKDNKKITHDDSLVHYINTSDLDDSVKMKVFTFFDIMLGKKVESFDRWLEMNNKKYPDDDLELRELAMNYLQLYEYMGMLKNAWEIVYDTKQSKGKEIVKKETYEEKVKRVKSFKSKDYIKEYVLAKELRCFSKEFIQFMEDNGISEIMINALNDDELNDWLIAYKKIKRTDMKLMRVLAESIGD